MTNTEKNKNIVKRIFSTVMWVILIFLIIVASWLAIDKYVRKSPVPSFMGYASLVIVSPSMSGTLEVDDLIIIRKCDEYKIGDIISYMKEGDKYSTTHRIVFYDENGDYLTKGDANNSRDAEPVYKDEIFGKVVLTVPNYAKFTRWLTQEGGWLYLGSAILIVILGFIILKSDNSEEALAQEANGSSLNKEEVKEDTLNSSQEQSNNSQDSAEQNNLQASVEDNQEKTVGALPNEVNETGEENK